MNPLNIQSLDSAAMAAAQKKWDAVAKPLHSLGEMEKIIVQIAGIQETEQVRLDKRCALIFCGDHGVVEEGVSQSKSDVTERVARSILEGTANISLMAAAAGAEVFAVDMGMAKKIDHPDLISRRQGPGTRNMTKGPAMTRQQAEDALQAGMDVMGEMKRRGYRIAVLGEMGIGNTTATSAMASVLLHLPVQALTGRGAGLSDAGLIRKISAIEKALAVNRPQAEDPIDVLAKVGGFEIAGMAGAFLGGMLHRIPVIVDGVITQAAALTALRICPAVRDFLLASHVSREPAGRLLLDSLGLEAVIHAGMALGEGTGAVMLLPLVDMALRVYQGPHTFDALGMDAYVPQGGKA